MTVHWFDSDPHVLALEAAVAGVMAVHDVAIRAGGRVVVFSGQFLRSPEIVYSQAAERFKTHGFIPLLRKEDARDVLYAYPTPAIGGPRRTWLNAVLFAMTVVTTLIAGMWYGMDPGQLEGPGSPIGFPAFVAAHWRAGIPFAAALLAILGVHEFGHYFVARHYKLDVSLPYFIPFFPVPPLAGTMGAVIRIQSPFESRKALFDVGIAGPLAGLLVAIPVVAAGLMQAEVSVVAPGTTGYQFGEPLLFQWMAWLLGPLRPAGTDIAMNPLLAAGWWGFFVTAVNLAPISQLDGGHISYGLFGAAHRYVAWTVFALALLMVFVGNFGFVVPLALIWWIGVEHPPALNDLTPIGAPRRLLGLVALLLFFLLIAPVPLSLM